MERVTLIVDASVVAKWFVEEDFSKEARLLMKKYIDGLVDLAAPNIMPYEVINALKYSRAFGEEELKRVAETLEYFQVALHMFSGELASKAIEIAMRKGLTIYDSSYIALAHKQNSILYTADQKILRKTDGKNVKHISQFSSKTSLT